MPQALAFVLPAVFAAGGAVPLVTAAGALTLVGSAVSVASGLLLTTAANALLAQRPETVKPANVKLNIKQALGPRVKHYGRVRAGGTIVFFRARDFKFYRVIVHGHGKIAREVQYFVDKKTVTLNSSGATTDGRYIFDGRSRVYLHTRLGKQNSPHYSELAAAYPVWDTDHRLHGLWTSLTVAEGVPAEDFQDMYPNGEPSVEIVADTSEIYDPRTGKTEFSDNAALVIADMIESEDGFGLAGKVNREALIHAANVSDQIVHGFRRWRLAGSYALTESPGAVLNRMLAACGGDVRLRPDGTIGIHVGEWEPPTVALTTSDIIELQTYATGPDGLDRYSEVSFSYVDPDLNFEEVTGTPIVSQDLIEAYGDNVVGPLLDMSFAPSDRQGRRAARIRMAWDNPQATITVRCKPRAIIGLYERFLSLDIPEIGATGYWRVLAYDLSPADGSVTYSLASIGPDAYGVDPDASDVQVLPDDEASTGIPAPSYFSAGGAGVKTSATTFAAGIGAVWDAPVSDVLSPKLEWKPTDGAVWRDFPVPTGALTAQITGLEDERLYDLRLSFTTTEARSPFATVTGVEASADISRPDQPTAMDVLDMGDGVARIGFTGSASLDVIRTEIRRGGTLIATVPTTPNQAITYDDESGPGSFTWSLRSVNSSGVDGAPDVTDTETIT